MRQCAVTRIVAGRAGAALANTRARIAGQVATDANLVARLHIAGENAVPESEFVDVSADGVVDKVEGGFSQRRLVWLGADFRYVVDTAGDGIAIPER